MLMVAWRAPHPVTSAERLFLEVAAGQIALALGRLTALRAADEQAHAPLIREHGAREQLDPLLGGVADGVVLQREDGTFVFANDAAARMAGFASASEYLGAQPFEIAQRLTVLDADGQPFPHEQLPGRRTFRGELAPEMVVQFRRADTGEPRWSRTRARLVRGVDGARLALSIFHDITEELRSRDRLRFLAEAGAQLAGALDVDETLKSLVRVASNTLADWAVVLLIDEDGAIQHIASAHREPEKDVLSRSLHATQLRHASGAKLLWEAIRTREPMLLPVVTDELMAESARNPEHLAMLRGMGLSSLLYAPMIGRDRVQGAIALFMAGSGRSLGEEDKAIATEMARRASLVLENARLYREAHDAIQARDELLSIASHELRTPVTAIRGVAQMTLRARERGTLDDARLARALDQLLHASQRLVTLTDDLLDVSRLQTGRFELRPETVNLGAFVADFVERFAAQLDEQHQVALVVAPPDPPASVLIVQADPARLEQVLANLLSNAVKYTPTGGAITVSVAQDDESGQIAVRDDGIGLPTGSEEAIFQPFGRATNAAHRQIPGMGLGLYICRQIVERHGGRIWAESPGDGLGTTIHVWLPRAGERQ